MGGYGNTFLIRCGISTKFQPHQGIVGAEGKIAVDVLSKMEQSLVIELCYDKVFADAAWAASRANVISENVLPFVRMLMTDSGCSFVHRYNRRIKLSLRSVGSPPVIQI